MVLKSQDIAGWGGGGNGGDRPYSVYDISTERFCIDQETSGASHFNVSSIIVRRDFSRKCSQTTAFEEKRWTDADSNLGLSVFYSSTLRLSQSG